MKYFLDLFSGIGGFALGAEWAGMKFDAHYFSEVDDYAIKVYRKRFPDAIPLGDITKLDGNALPKGEWIIAGGFPCQDISVAGKGAGLDGGRSGLWFEYARIIGELRPRFAIMENVGALTIRGLDRVLGSLAEIGYDAEWQDIRASDVGAPHRRERIWIVAYPNAVRSPGNAESRKQLDWPAQPSGSRTDGMDAGNDVADAEGERRGTGRTRGLDCDSSRETERTLGTLADTANGRNVRRDGELESTESEMHGHNGSAADGRWEWWSTEPDVGRVANGIPSRVDRLKCLGNSIVPDIARRIFEELKGDI